MHIVDSHAHLDFQTIADDLDGVLERAFAANVKTILAVGIGDGPDTMHRARDLAVRFAGHPGAPRIVASAGIHPQEANAATPDALDKLEQLAADPHVVAIGETGLDYYHADNPDIDIQQQAFLAQLDIARKARKPILIHCRTSEPATPQAKARYGQADAIEDLFRLIEQNWTPFGIGGIMHCFSGNAAQAQRSLDLGFHVSFAGNVTYPRFPFIRAAIPVVPLDRLLVETDSPFLAPQPHKGQRNEPAYTRITAEFIAEQRGISAEDLAGATTANFKRLFSLTG